MLFNSLSFAVFFPVVWILYWLLKGSRLNYQNLLLLSASYFFYACWDYRFLFLLLFSTALDFYSAIKISESRKHEERRFWFWLSILINIGFLGVFKYYNFFAESFAASLSYLGLEVNVWTLKVILPVGISFYTFHGLSYVVDVYSQRIPPERNFIEYSLFVSFFPLLVAGPIERATHLLPQIKRQRVFNYTQAVDGLRQMLWGFVKKVVIADTCAEYVNLIFNNSSDLNGSTLVLGAVLFAFQIYCDFSGYSDIALGVARLFGIELLQNFSFPYFSRDIAEFWRRWHISLTTWFRDYLYIPLGGSKGKNWLKIRNTFIIFLVSGFWHGANWTFIVWGALNALYFLPLLLLKRNRNNLEIVAKGRFLPSLREAAGMILTFGLTVFAWIFFRAENLTHAVHYIKKIFSSSLFTVPSLISSSAEVQLENLPSTGLKVLFLMLILFTVTEWMGREGKYALQNLGFKLPGKLRWAMYYILIIAVIYFAGSEEQFIYFQF